MRSSRPVPVSICSFAGVLRPAVLVDGMLYHDEIEQLVSLLGSSGRGPGPRVARVRALGTADPFEDLDELAVVPPAEWPRRCKVLAADRR